MPNSLLPFPEGWIVAVEYLRGLISVLSSGTWARQLASG